MGAPLAHHMVDEVFYSFLLFSIQPCANRIGGDLQKYTTLYQALMSRVFELRENKSRKNKIRSALGWDNTLP